MDPRVSAAGRSRPLTDASPGPERSSGRRVRTRRHSFRGRPRTRTPALFRTESQSFLGARAIEKTQRLAFLGETGIPERKLPDEGRGGYRAARRDRGARADGGMRRPVTRLAPSPERRLLAANAQSSDRKPEAFNSRATAYARPTGLPFPQLLPYASTVHGDSDHETDGLSRNPDDCVRWGCVDH